MEKAVGVVWNAREIIIGLKFLLTLLVNTTTSSVSRCLNIHLYKWYNFCIYWFTNPDFLENTFKKKKKTSLQQDKMCIYYQKYGTIVRFGIKKELLKY